MTETTDPTESKGPLLWALLILVGAALLAVSSESLWIDEMAIAAFGSTPSLEYTWQWMQHVHFREMQAPFYIAYMWVWIHLFGDGEWTLRMANVPWFILGAWIFTFYIGRMMRAMTVTALVTAFSALAWHYLNEARVYSFQLGFALAVAGAAVEVARTTIVNGAPSRTALRLLAFFFVGLAGSSVLGAVWGGAAFVAILVAVPKARWLALIKATPAAALVSGVILVGLFAYYDWTRTLNLQATQVGTTTPASMVFVFYELLGLAGLGPGRNDLRGGGIATLKPHLPMLVLFATAAAFVLWQGGRRIVATWSWRRALVVAALLITPVFLIFAFGVLTRFRVLGRHVIPVLPFVLLLFAAGVAHARRGGRLSRWIAVGFVGLCVASCLTIRFAPRHAKDDYRAAATVARRELAAGHVVWWNADIRGPFHYRFPVAGHSTNGGAFSLQNPAPSDLTNLPAPQVIISSKPDTYDAAGAVQNYVRDRGYQAAEHLPAFTIWVPAK